MSLSTFDDGVLWHPKMTEAGEDATNLWFRSVIYSNRFTTDGVIRKGAVASFTKKSPKVVADLAARLVDVGLWIVAPDGSGWTIHDFLQWNRSKEEKASRAQQISEERSKAGKAGNAVRWGTDRKAIANGSQTPSQEGVANSQDHRPSYSPSPSVPSQPEENSPLPPPGGSIAKPKVPRPATVPTAAPTNARERGIYDVLVSDAAVAAVVRQPADLAARLAAAYPRIDVATELLKAIAWSVAKSRPIRKATFFTNWLNNAEEPSLIDAAGPIIANEPEHPIIAGRRQHAERMAQRAMVAGQEIQ